MLFKIFNFIAQNERTTVNDESEMLEKTVAAHLRDNPSICQEELKKTTKIPRPRHDLGC
jgi:hypothetical protein